MIRCLCGILVLCLLVTGCGLQAPQTLTGSTEATIESSIFTEPDPTAETNDGETQESSVPSTAPSTEATTPPTEVTTTPPETKPTEPVTPAETPKDDTFVRVTDYIPDILVDLRYATSENFTGQIIYEFTDVYLRYGTVKKLAAVQKALKEKGLGLKVWDGYRPVYGQYRLWEACPDPTYVSDPAKGTSSHCRGNTVDVTLVDSNGKELEMPTGFDDFTAKADRDYSDCTQTAAANAKLLEDLMKEHGFRGYDAEWWHYTDTKSYDVEKQFDPAVTSQWVVNCNQSVSLRKRPDTAAASIASVKKGKTVRLLGWNQRFAYVEYQGKRGYILGDYILPKEETVTSQLTIVQPTNVYTYQQMQADLAAMADQYDQWVTLSSIGTSENGVEIPLLLIGKTDAKHHVLIHAGIHGREHMTCWLLTALAEHWLKEAQMENWDVCFHLIPMVNPDGVEISQTGVLTEAQKTIYKRDLRLAYTYLSAKQYAAQWKANAKGVDLNRNFDAGWKEYDGREDPSSERYKGEKAFSAAEAEALRQYTLKYEFDATVSYHASGSIIYSTCGKNKTVNKLSDQLARDIGFVTGYPLISSLYVDRAGYKDWAGDVLGIPSITIEIGCELAPLQSREIESIFNRNRSVFCELARWVTNQ